MRTQKPEYKHFKFCLLVGFYLLHFAVGDSQIIGWGNNFAGQITGSPSITNDADLVRFNHQVEHAELISTGCAKIAGKVLSTPVAIAAGYSHCLALNGDGTVYGWGWNLLGQATGTPTTSDLNAANGLVTISNQVLTNIIAIAAGRTHSVALKKDGTVVMWGAPNPNRHLSPPVMSNVVAIAASWNGILALQHDGTVIGWQVKVPHGLSNIVAIAASVTFEGQNLALKRDGTVIQWDNYGNSGSLVAGLSNIVSLAAGTDHNLALNRNGEVFSFNGDHNNVAISGPLLTNVIEVKAGNGFSLALKNDGTVTSFGKMLRQPASVPVGLTNIVEIAAGGDFCLAVTTNNIVAEKFR